MGLIGVNHISLCTSQGAAGAAASALSTLGFAPRFCETNLRVPAERRQFMGSAADRHDVAVYHSRRGPDIEIVSHGAASAPTLPSDSPYRPVIEQRGVVVSVTSDDSAIAGALGRPVNLHQLGAGLPWYVTVAGSGPGPVGLVISSASPSSSATFWREGIGFRPVAEGPDWQRLVFPALLPQWEFFVAIVRSDRRQRPALDDDGWTTACFITTALDQSIARLLKHGATEVGTPFSMVMNARAVMLCFLRGPDGELIELLQPAS